MKQINKLLSHSLKNRWHLFPDYIRRSRANSHFDLDCVFLHIWLCLAGRGLAGAMWLSAGCYWSSPGGLHSLHGRSPDQAADLKSRPAGFSLWGWACGVWARTLRVYMRAFMRLSLSVCHRLSEPLCAGTRTLSRRIRTVYRGAI